MQHLGWAGLVRLAAALAGLVVAAPAGALSLYNSFGTSPSYSISFEGYYFNYYEPPPPPPVAPTPDPLLLQFVGNDVIELSADTPSGATNRLYRQRDGGSWSYLKTLAAGTRNEVRDEGLRLGSKYCYRLDMTNSGGTTQDFLCATTPWRVAFAGLAPLDEEMDEVLRLFDWRDTRALDEGTPEDPSLYYMNVLIDDAAGVAGLRDGGIHVRSMPVFPEEMADWSENETLAVQGDTLLGRWLYAVVPGVLFNEVRIRALEQISRGEEPGIRAMVFRRVPVQAARALPLDDHRVSLVYLAERGFEYASPDEGTCAAGEECPLFFGWLAKKLGGWTAEALEDVYEKVREGFAQVAKLWNDEVTVTLELHALNTDPAFGTGTPMTSAWDGRRLPLPGVGVHVRQGVAMFSGTTDAAGRVTLTLFDDKEGQICIDLSNDTAKLTELLTDKTICPGKIADFGDRSFWEIGVGHRYANVLAAMSDADAWVKNAIGYDMPKLTVLVGWLADWLTVDNRSMTPCLGRAPHDTSYLGEILFNFVVPYSGTIADFLYAVDIGISRPDDSSRGVAVHEYGHAVLCQMMLSASYDLFKDGWSDVVLAAANQSADNEPAYLNEAFADFLSAQIVGGTSYFPTQSDTKSMEMKYAVPGSQGLDRDYDEGDLSGLGTGEQGRFQAQVRRVASLLHDAFDNGVGMNDGTHWQGSPLTRVAANDSDLRDDLVGLPLTALRDVIERTAGIGHVLREHTLLGALAGEMEDAGYSEGTVCGLFARHSSDNRCPDYVSESSGTSYTSTGSDTEQASADFGITSSGGSSGSTTSP
jgi:hypothetical protein